MKGISVGEEIRVGGGDGDGGGFQGSKEGDEFATASALLIAHISNRSTKPLLLPTPYATPHPSIHPSYEHREVILATNLA